MTSFTEDHHSGTSTKCSQIAFAKVKQLILSRVKRFTFKSEAVNFVLRNTQTFILRLSVGRLRSSGLGHFLVSWVVNQALVIGLVQGLGWVFETQEREKKIGSPVWGVKNAVAFKQGILQQNNHIGIFSLAHWLLESAKNLWGEILWLYGDNFIAKTQYISSF